MKHDESPLRGTPVRKLKSGTVVRMHSRNRERKAGDDGATTPGVAISVSFEDKYLHRAHESPQGSLEKSVKLKFASEPNPVRRADEPHQSPPPFIRTSAALGPAALKKADTSRVYPKPLNDPQPGGLIVPRGTRKDRKRPEPPLPVPRIPINLVLQEEPKPRRRVGYGLALAGLAAVAILVPTQLDVGAGFDVLLKKEETVVAQNPVSTEADLPIPTPAGVSAKMQDILAEEAPQQEVLVTASAEQDLLEPETAKPAPNASLSDAPVTEVSALDIDQQKPSLDSGRISPPRPQKLAKPSVAGLSNFVPPQPVVTPPDPNTMAVVPENPFADLSLTGFKPQPALPTHLASASNIWAADDLAIPSRTDLVAAASPMADAPPPPVGPVVQSNVAALRAFKAQFTTPDVPKKLNTLGTRVIASTMPGLQDAGLSPFAAPIHVTQTELVAAVLIVRPEQPKVQNPELANTPDRAVLADLRQQFIKPPTENRNSDSAVDPIVAQTAIPLVPAIGVGPLKILNQIWTTDLQIELEEAVLGARIVSHAPVQPDWLKTGSILTAVNSQKILSQMDYSDALRKACGDVLRGKADLNMTLDGASRSVEVNCEMRTSLSNGLVFQTNYKRRNWRIQVIEPAVLGQSELQQGDLLLLDYRRDVKLNTPDAIRDSILSAREAQVERLEFGIIRNGAIENANLDLIVR